MDRTSHNAILLEMAADGSREAEEKLIKDNMGLVRSIASRFAGRITGKGLEIEDLVQIGCLGMLKAVRGYDKSYETAFSTYAVPLIIGEIKRFLRDDGLIKVSREAKRNNSILMKAKEEYILANGVEPVLGELCKKCGIEMDDAVFAMEACTPVLSINAKTDENGKSIEEIKGEDCLGELTEKIALGQAIEKLDEESRKIIYLRYVRDLTQNETAKQLGLTQVKVSRREKKIIMELRNILKEV